MPYCHRPWVWFPRCHRGASCALPKTGHVQRRGRDQSAAQCGFHRGRVGDPPEVLAGTFFFVSIFIPKEPWNPWDTHSGVIISYCREKICDMFNHQIASQGHAAHGPESGHLAVVGYAQGLWLGFVVRLKNFHIFPSWHRSTRHDELQTTPARDFGLWRNHQDIFCLPVYMYSPNSWVIIPLFVKRDYVSIWIVYIIM